MAELASFLLAFAGFRAGFVDLNRAFRHSRIPSAFMNVNTPKPLVGIIMGSQSDWSTLEHAATTLEDFSIPFEKEIVSAHRTPEWLFEYASNAEERGLHC